MNQALYRRYRPETFAELIGQSQVTAPLMTALKTDRVNHAYLFSGPRGCGKTTSARILARCLNCAEGPTDTPCGKCPSCIELSRDGSGSLDVVEIDAASHNGVDDARDLRERAIFAPARDRYKIFILDEAHMVTPQGFNALLKIVEEPPAHVKFIFATTEPEKVIGTIRSRTHHYPFRLVPPAQMLAYLEEVCKSEIVTPGPGVLTLVVRAGGGSVRDSLSLLDQLMAGSEIKGGKAEIEYDRAAALLGYTHASLLDEVVDAFATQNSSLVFSSVDKVIQSGQDPRRFVEDLLEKLRDLIVVLSVGDDAKAVLRGIADDELEKMKLQAMSFGMNELTHAANAVSAALSEMSGATSPKLQLELMCAKVLVPSSDKTEVGSLARIERLERRMGVAQSPDAAPVQAAPVKAAPAKSAPAAVAQPVEPAVVKSAPAAPVAKPATQTAPSTNGVSTQAMIAAWPEILSQVKAESKSAWVVAFTLTVMDLSGDVLTLKFLSHKDLDGFKADSRSTDALRKAIFAVLGLAVKFKPHVEESGGEVVAEAAAEVHPPTTAIPVVKAEEPAAPEAKSRNGMVNEEARYGESLLREMLGAEPMQDPKAGGR
ncbi:MAG: DNA polymerase III subunit gamma and tau [Actinobacteria bacterium]|uniref:DNA-directed DNA polymerase n=1 Tax=freshwater metagenome TaxID=449393 RepID=A0A6J6IWM8_9ZZZZ|nr:DNA polymerase III subunit gamma and tau [Actinomycetota bacterium]